MAYRKDLHLIPKSRLSTIAGVFSIVFGILVWVFHDYSVFWIPNSLFLIIMGVLAFANGRGYNPERLIGKCFIEINEIGFSFKPTAYKKIQNVKWSEVVSVHYVAATYIFECKDGSRYKIDLKTLEFELIQEIKEVVSSMLKSQDIQLISE